MPNPFTHQYLGCPHPLQIHCSLNCLHLCLTGVQALSQCCLHRCNQCWPFFQTVYTMERRIYKYTTKCFSVRPTPTIMDFRPQWGWNNPLNNIEIHTFSFHHHLVSAGHHTAHPGKSGINTAPQRLWKDSREFKSTIQLQKRPSEGRVSDNLITLKTQMKMTVTWQYNSLLM